MGNTMSIDMGNTFTLIAPDLRGHVKSTFGNSATAGVCEVGFEGPTNHVAVVSDVRIEPQERLQMEGALRARRNPWALRPEAPTPQLAKANESAMVDPNSASAAEPSQLGKSQTAGWIAQEILRSTSSCGPYDWQMAKQNATQPAPWPPFSQRPTKKAGRPDCSWSQQSCLDRGFQRLVSYSRWLSDRTIDGAGFVQSLCAEHSVIARSKMGAGAADLSETVQKLRLSIGHPNGQRQSVWNHRPSRAFAVECLVDSAGHPSGVHCARSSRTEWRARADASGVQGRNNQAKLAECAGPTTAHRSMGLHIRPDSSARGFRPAASRGSLSAQAPSGEETALEVCAPLGAAAGSKQRSDQVARPKALRRGSLCWIQGGSQAHPGQQMQSLLWPFADRGTVRIRRGCHASRQVYSEGGENTEAHVLKTPSRMSRTKSKRLISDFRESILPTGPHNGVGTQLMMQLRRLQRSTMCSPLDPPAECPATGSLRARWEPRTGVRSLGSHRRYPSRRPFRRAASREEQVLPLRGSGWITIFRAAKCNPCVCLKCHPCLCPLPLPGPLPVEGRGSRACVWFLLECAHA